MKTASQITSFAIQIVALSFMGAVFAEAATSSATVTLRATIVAESSLSVTDADLSGAVSSATKSAAVAANVRGGSPATLTIEANDENGWGDIPSGVLNAKVNSARGNFSPVKTSPGSGGRQGFCGSYSATFEWYLAKSWIRSALNNNLIVTYILVSP